MKPLEYYEHWHFKNTALLVLSLVVLFFITDTQAFQNLIAVVSGFGYLGVFAIGLMLASVYTVASASVILFGLVESFDPLVIALIAGLGAVVADYVIFRFLKDRVLHELEPLVKHMGGSYLGKLFHTPYFIWLIPFVGAVIIASPLPDELGISMLGLSKIGNWPFVALSFLLNAIGIFIIVTLARAF